MNIIKKILRDKEKKTIFNIITALFIGVLLIVMSNTLFKTNNEGTEIVKEADLENVSLKNEQFEEDFIKNLEKRLENILSSVEGVGETKVMITLKSTSEIVVAKDSVSDISSENGSEKGGEENRKIELKNVVINNNEPLILTEIQPQIEGVMIIAKGGGNIGVKNSIIKAVQALLGIEINKIEVLKMK